MSSTTRHPPSPGTAACPDDAPDPDDAPAPNDAPAPSVLALIARRARDPTLGRACAVRWLPSLSLRGTPPEEWSYRRLWIAAERAAERLRAAVPALAAARANDGAPMNPRGDAPGTTAAADPPFAPPRLSALQSDASRAWVVGSFVEAEGFAFAGATLAVALAGAAYAPLVAADPVDRLAAAAASAGVVALITDVRADPTHAEAAERLGEAIERRGGGGGGKGRGGKGAGGKAGGKGERFGAFVVVDASDLFPDAEEEDEGADAFASASASLASASASSPSSASLSDSAIASIDRPAALASVFFTSGSTGAPKGCLVHRGALAAHCAAKVRTHGISAGDVVFVASPHAFDPSLCDAFAALSAGAIAAFAPRRLAHAELGACLLRARATHACATPTALRTIRERERDELLMRPNDVGSKAPNGRANPASALRVVAAGGEALDPTLAAAWLGGGKGASTTVTLANTYGVTECCGYQTFARVASVAAQRALGAAMGGACEVRFGALDHDPFEPAGGAGGGGGDSGEGEDAALEEGRRSSSRRAGDERFVRRFRPPVAPPDPSPGTSDLVEVWLRGDQVGLGYASAPEHTAERFFLEEGKADASADASAAASSGVVRWFRTGDVARRVSDANGFVSAALVGRLDAQVKINGRRVELGDVDAAVKGAAPRLVAESAAVVADADGRLVAWCACRDEEHEGPPESDHSDAHPNAAKDSDGSSGAIERAFGERVSLNVRGESPSYSEDSRRSPEDEDGKRKKTALRRAALRWLVAAALPAALVPSRFAFADRLPTTRTGKLDRKALAARDDPPGPDAFAIGEDGDFFDEGVGGRKEEGNEKKKGGAIRALVADAWSRALGGVPAASIRDATRFDELGGDSIVALRVSRALADAFFPDDDDVRGGAFGEGLDGALAPAAMLREPGSAFGAFSRGVERAASEGRLGEIAARLSDEGEAEEDEGEAEDQAQAEAQAEASNAKASASNASARAPARRAARGSSLLLAAARLGDALVLESLLDAGVPASGGDLSAARRFSPLHAACASAGAVAGAAKCAEALLRRGADARARCAARRGATPIHLASAACAGAHARSAERLLAALIAWDARENEANGVSANANAPPRRGGGGRNTSLRSRTTSTASTSASFARLAAADDDGQTAMHHAARAGASRRAIHLLADAWARSRGESRGASSGGGGDTAVVAAFLERRDAWGRSALHWAAVNGAGDAVKALAGLGADASARDDAGETPVDAAERRARCGAAERPDGARASAFGDIAAALGGSGATKHLKKQRAREKGWAGGGRE